ncbi:protein kinase [Cystobacter fuscus]|uniref:protein kinase n=1 Tax=Cystobacter fuscus TaxID=43 RepID=UPI002B2B8761|nr:protein kinase [Cystobacter fuscus]
MSDTTPREGSRLGSYILGRLHPDSDPALGDIYEAHHIETGARALVLVPNPATPWAPRASWSVRSLSEVSPPFLAVEVERTPGATTQALHELTLLHMRLSGALACVEDREDTASFLSRASHGVRALPRRRELSMGLTVFGGMAFGMGLLLLWLQSHSPTVAALDSGTVQTVAGEPVKWIDVAADAHPGIGYPLPSTPIKGQQKPPCLEGTAVEINGGCWVTLEQRSPCPRSTAEYQGKCYMPLRNPPPEPRSLQP